MAAKRFTFPLDSVLRLRRHETELARQALARATEEVRKQEARLEQARAHLEACTAALPTGRALGPARLRQHEAFRQDAQQAYDEAHRHLETLRRREADARDALRRTCQAEEALQTLHDQQRARFLKDRETAENAELDEHALSGYYRQQQSS